MSLEPSSRLFSYSCIATGADTEIQPESGALSGVVSGTTSDAVLPASIVTLCFTVPWSLVSATECSPGVRSLIVTGDTPRGTPSTATWAPAGSLRICSCPVAATLFGRSMYCETCAPAVMVSGIVRGSPAPRRSTTCAPAFSVSVSGVAPRASPSTSTWAPGGFVLMTSVPVAAASADGTP